MRVSSAERHKRGGAAVPVTNDGPSEGLFGPIPRPGGISCEALAPLRDHRGCFGGGRSAGGAGRQRLVDGVVAHVDVRGPTYKGSLTGGAKSLFRLPPKGPPLPRLVLAEAAIDALSFAAIESLRKDTLYAATGGGMGPGTIAALEALLADISMLPGALLCTAADANGPGDRFADRHRSLGEKFRIPFARLRPPIEGGDWNDVLRARSETRGVRP